MWYLSQIYFISSINYCYTYYERMKILKAKCNKNSLIGKMYALVKEKDKIKVILL